MGGEPGITRAVTSRIQVGSLVAEPRALSRALQALLSLAPLSTALALPLASFLSLPSCSCQCCPVPMEICQKGSLLPRATLMYSLLFSMDLRLLFVLKIKKKLYPMGILNLNAKDSLCGGFIQRPASVSSSDLAGGLGCLA